MKVTLKQIQLGYQALSKLAALNLPATHIKTAWRIKRISEGAQKVFEDMRGQMNKLIMEYGAERADNSGVWDVTPANMEKFNAVAEDFLSAQVEIHGEPFTLSEIEKLGDLATFSASDLAALDWLIVEETPKTMGASAD